MLRPVSLGAVIAFQAHCCVAHTEPPVHARLPMFATIPAHHFSLLIYCETFPYFHTHGTVSAPLTCWLRRTAPRGRAKNPITRRICSVLTLHNRSSPRLSDSPNFSIPPPCEVFRLFALSWYFVIVYNRAALTPHVRWFLRVK